jgi:hypothetical protein
VDENLIRQIIKKTASETAERTRGHFDAVAERLEGTIQLVAEGVAASREQVALFQVEMQREFEES